MIDIDMGISKALKIKLEQIDFTDKEKLLKMSIEDKVSFQEIKKTFNLTPGEVEKFLLSHIGDQRFKRWKIRQQKRSTFKGRVRPE
jgi:uncharacterized protein (TIGR03643 family)